MYACEDTNPCACTYTNTDTLAGMHTNTHINTQVENTPDSGLRELTKRENPADISSPLKSASNDDRIGLPMEMSPQ